jgi:transposase
MGHVIGESRYQATLYPETLDEVIASDSAVRVIDAFVDSLDLAGLGFSRVEAEATGRPPYDPRDLLKLYIYGYLNQIRSSRRLERETERNVEVFWLINRVTPVFKTIADFRKDHPEAIVGACRAFIKFCREQSAFGGEVLAIDGSKIAAAASRKQVITKQKLAEREAVVERKIAEYLTAMD